MVGVDMFQGLAVEEVMAHTLQLLEVHRFAAVHTWQEDGKVLVVHNLVEVLEGEGGHNLQLLAHCKRAEVEGDTSLVLELEGVVVVMVVGVVGHVWEQQEYGQNSSVEDGSILVLEEAAVVGEGHNPLQLGLVEGHIPL